MICWNLWNRRNRWVWDKISITEFGVVAKVMNMLSEWRQNCLERCKYKAMVSTSPRRWQPPQQGWMKINVDAAIFMESSCIGIGSVIRDEHGNFVRARNQKISEMYQPRKERQSG